MPKPRPPNGLSETGSELLYALRKNKAHQIRKYLKSAPNNYPRFLYKYIPSSMDIDKLRCLLIDSDFYLSPVSVFNDPFDTSAKVVNVGSPKQKRKRFTEIFRKHHPSSKRRELDQLISDAMARHHNDVSIIETVFKVHTHAAGLSCFSENPRNILMWSHYASKHQGAVLQFNISKDLGSMLYALKMHYSHHYPIFNFAVDLAEQFESIMLRKASDWSYEKEWRILRIGGADTFQPFKPQALTGIIFGSRCTDNFRVMAQQVINERRAVGHPHINIYQAEQHPSKYAIRISRGASLTLPTSAQMVAAI